MTNLLSSVKDIVREGARRARIQKYGILHASGGAAGSPRSMTPKRALKRAQRRAEHLAQLRLSEHNPAGSKLRRRFAKAATGMRHDYQEACEWLPTHFAAAEPKFRQGESKARVAAGRAW